MIIGAGAGGGPQISVYNGTNGTLLASFFDPHFANPPSVAGLIPDGIHVGLTALQGRPIILGASGPVLVPAVDEFDAQTSALLGGLFAFPTTFVVGVFVGGWKGAVPRSDKRARLSLRRVALLQSAETDRSALPTVPPGATAGRPCRLC
jgi:hypothetical protein